eukprot:12904313-Prorocentrum_lima.AAC.1
MQIHVPPQQRNWMNRHVRGDDVLRVRGIALEVFPAGDYNRGWRPPPPRNEIPRRSHEAALQVPRWQAWRASRISQTIRIARADAW